MDTAVKQAHTAPQDASPASAHALVLLRAVRHLQPPQHQFRRMAVAAPHTAGRRAKGQFTEIVAQGKSFRFATHILKLR